MEECPLPNYANFAAYIAQCVNQPRVQAPNENHPQNPSRPDVTQEYFLDLLWTEAEKRESP